MMKQILFASLVFTVFGVYTANAQPYQPPDPYNDIDNNNYGIWPNMGQAKRSDNLYLGDQGYALYVIVVDAAQVAKWVPVR